MQNFKNFKQVAIETVAKRRARNIDNICRYGIKILDDYLWWISENELVVIGAGSWIGKTELSSSIAIHNAMRWKKVALFSLEWDMWELVYRYFQREINLKRTENFLKWPEYRLNLKNVELEEDRTLENIPKELEENLFIFDKSFIPDRTKLLQLMKDMYNQVDLFVIDHLHYLDFWADERNGLSDIIKWVKEMTEILNKPVIMVSHLSRAYATQNRLPTKSDLHGSSNIEKNANTIVLLTPWEMNEELAMDSEARYLRPTQIIVDKNRTWMPVPAMFNTTFDLRTKTYLEWEKHEYLSPDEKNKITIHDKIF